MNPQKEQYLTQIRSNTAYPVLRGFLGVIEILSFVLPSITAFVALILGIAFMSQVFLGGVFFFVAGLIVSGLIFLILRILNELGLILADIGDSITETNSKTQQ